MGLSKARGRETIGVDSVTLKRRRERSESTELDYGKGERLGSGQLDGYRVDGGIIARKYLTVDREIMVRGGSF